MEIIEITGMAHGGEGVGRINGQVCFVVGALPGDVVHVNINKATSKALWGDVASVETPSPYRQLPACEKHTNCGCCGWGHFSYPAQAEWKCQIVSDCLERLAGMHFEPEWIEAPVLREAYRTRASYHGDGKRLGFYASGTHTIDGEGYCFLCHPKLNAALKQLRDTGIKGNVTVTVNPEGDEVMVWLPSLRRKVRDRFPMTDAAADAKGPTPKGRPGRSRFMFDGIPIVNGAFSQASLLLNRLLVKQVHHYLKDSVSVLDLYCGSGNLSLTLDSRIEVLGIEHNKEAVKAAYALRKGAYVAGNESSMRKHIQDGTWDTILLDPPRTGAKTIATDLAKCSARSLVYVSCDPATLARDLKTLCTGGWFLESLAILDLFPNTPHVETVCRLVRR